MRTVSGRRSIDAQSQKQSLGTCRQTCSFTRMSTQDNKLSDLVERIGERGDGQDHVSVHDIREMLGERSFGPFIALPALIEITPIGGIPGVPTLIAVMITLVCAQMLFGRNHLWLPNVLERKTLAGDRVKDGMKWLERPADWIDRVLRPRLSWFSGTVGLRIVALLCILLCITVPPLELLPFASTIPMGAIALMGLGLMVRDGLVILIAALGASLGLGTLLMSTVSGV
jgi:hypothetical protein